MVKRLVGIIACVSHVWETRTFVSQWQVGEVLFPLSFFCMRIRRVSNLFGGMLLRMRRRMRPDTLILLAVVALVGFKIASR